MNRPDVQSRLPRHLLVRTPSPIEEPPTTSTSTNQPEDHQDVLGGHLHSDATLNELNQSQPNISQTSRPPHRSESTPGGLRTSTASLPGSLNFRYRGASEGGVHDDFFSQGTFNLLPDRNTQSKRLNVVSTCSSPTGDTLGVVCEQSFWVYKLSSTNPRLKCMGKIDGQTQLYNYGLDDAQHTGQRNIVTESNKRGFGCAALSDNLLAIGALHSNCFMLFSVTDEDQGRCVFKKDTKDYIVSKIMFNPEATELVVLSALLSQKLEMFQFYSAVGPLSQQSNSEVNLSMKYTMGDNIFSYETIDACFSSNGRKIVTLTKHHEGSVIVFILEKEDGGGWAVLGPSRIETDLDIRDDDRLCFTGVSLYVYINDRSLTYSYRREKMQNDLIIFSLDHPVATSPDCYRIEPEGNSFVLSEIRQRVCLEGRHLAIAVLSRDSGDMVAVLSWNGNLSLE